MARVMGEIQAEYSHKMALLGDAHYRIRLLQSDIIKLSREIGKLNQEARKAHERDQATSAQEVSSESAE
ncbi:MAG: hypothetical protein NVS1B10_08890 [Candidatus Saccharimonadales bacterium]